MIAPKKTRKAIDPGWPLELLHEVSAACLDLFPLEYLIPTPPNMSPSLLPTVQGVVNSPQ